MGVVLVDSNTICNNALLYVWETYSKLNTVGNSISIVSNLGLTDFGISITDVYMSMSVTVVAHYGIPRRF